MPLKIDIEEQKPGMYLVALDGRLDTDTAAELEKRLEPVLASAVRAVRFDMSKLGYISSMGIRVLFMTAKALKPKGAMFLMANPQPQIKKVLEIAKALPPESIFVSVEEADEYFASMQRKVLEQDSDE